MQIDIEKANAHIDRYQRRALRHGIAVAYADPERGGRVVFARPGDLSAAHDRRSLVAGAWSFVASCWLRLIGDRRR